jgi:hypothetical protein
MMISVECGRHAYKVPTTAEALMGLRGPYHLRVCVPYFDLFISRARDK